MLLAISFFEPWETFPLSFRNTALLSGAVVNRRSISDIMFKNGMIKYTKLQYISACLV